MTSIPSRDDIMVTPDACTDSIQNPCKIWVFVLFVCIARGRPDPRLDQMNRFVALLLLLLLTAQPAWAGLSVVKSNGITLTGADGINYVGINGITLTGADGIFNYNSNGITLTGADGITLTGADGVTS